MSRVGLNRISIPDGVTVSVSGSNVNIKGPKGELNQKFDTDFKLNIEDNTLTVARPSNQKRHKALHGLYRALILIVYMVFLKATSINLSLLVLVIKLQIKAIYLI